MGGKFLISLYVLVTLRNSVKMHGCQKKESYFAEKN